VGLGGRLIESDIARGEEGKSYSHEGKRRDSLNSIWSGGKSQLKEKETHPKHKTDGDGKSKGKPWRNSHRLK